MKIIKQAFSFFGISGIGWLMDILIYTTLLKFRFHPSICNIFSSLVAITFVYLISTKNLFINKETLSIKKKYIIYVLYQIFIILFSSFIIGYLSNILLNTDIKILYNYAEITAKILITPFTMITNFIFMKFLIKNLGGIIYAKNYGLYSNVQL